MKILWGNEGCQELVEAIISRIEWGEGVQKGKTQA